MMTPLIAAGIIAATAVVYGCTRVRREDWEFGKGAPYVGRDDPFIKLRK